MRTVGSFLATLALAGALMIGAAGCKQGRGERCQLDSDCSCSADDPKDDDKCVIVSGLEGLCCEGSGLPSADASMPDANMSMIDSAVPDATAADSGTD